MMEANVVLLIGRVLYGFGIALVAGSFGAVDFSIILYFVGAAFLVVGATFLA